MGEGRDEGMTTRRQSNRSIRPRTHAVRFTIGTDLGLNTNRGTLLTPTTGKALEILRVKAIQETADGLHLIELYFGTGTNIDISPSKGIDILRVADLSEDTSQTYLRGTGPTGLKNEVLSARHRSTPATVHKLLIWYTELDPKGGGAAIEFQSGGHPGPLPWTA